MKGNLPKIVHPVFECEIPSTGKTFKYRTYTVGEEKVLKIAMESGEFHDAINAIAEITEACNKSDDIDIKSLTSFDLEWIFMNMRMMSTGSLVKLQFKNNNCQAKPDSKCKEVIEHTIDLNDVKVFKGDEQWNANTENYRDGKNFKLTESIGIVIKYPTLEEMKKLRKFETEAELEDFIIQSCITKVFNEESVFVRDVDFDEEDLLKMWNDSPIPAKVKIREFMETIPELRLSFEFKCEECGYTEPVTLKGLNDFFD